MNYRSYLKNKSEYPFFGPPCIYTNWLFWCFFYTQIWFRKLALLASFQYDLMKILKWQACFYSFIAPPCMLSRTLAQDWQEDWSASAVTRSYIRFSSVGVGRWTLTNFGNRAFCPLEWSEAWRPWKITIYNNDSSTLQSLIAVITYLLLCAPPGCKQKQYALCLFLNIKVSNIDTEYTSERKWQQQFTWNII